MKMRATFVALLLAAFVVTAAPAWGAQSICDGVAGNLVTNCGFEIQPSPPLVFADWSFTGNVTTSGQTSFMPHSGMFTAFLGQVGSEGLLTQKVGTNATLYNLSFYVDNFSDATNNFTVFWNGVDIGPDLVNAAPFSYTLFSVNNLAGNAGAGSNTLTFQFRHDDLFWLLDDIVVTKATSVVPEPSSLLLMGSGLLGLAGLVRRKPGG